MTLHRSIALGFVCLSSIAACGVSQTPSSPAAVPKPTVVSPVIALVPPSPPPTSSGEPARSPVPIDVPTSACTLDVTSPPSTASTEGRRAPLGIEHVYVGAAPIAHTRSLGDIRRVRLVFVEKRPGIAVVTIDADQVSLVGAVPLHVGTTDDLVLYPKTRILRDGWLDYAQLSIALVGQTTLGPKTDLDPGITPASGAPFDVPCTELTPFGSTADEPVPDHELRGKAIALEDESGKKLATIEAETLMPPARGETKSRYTGKPVVVLAKKGKRTKIRLEAGRSLHAEGWVASRFVKESPWGGLGYGTGTGRAPKLDELTCERDVPLWADVQGTTFAVGTLHAHRTIAGKLDAKNDFRVELGSGARMLGSAEPKKGDPVDPYVPRHELAACSDPRPQKP